MLLFKKKNLGNIIVEVFKWFKVIEIFKMFDCMKDLGYKYLIYVGIIVGIVDISVLNEK